MKKVKSLVVGAVVALLAPVLWSADYIVFIHGWSGGADTWERMVDLMTNPTYGAPFISRNNVLVVEYGGESINDLASKVWRQITNKFGETPYFWEQITDDNIPAGACPAKLDFVVHSMGGLVLRSMVAKGFLPDSMIDHVVTLGTPHYGVRALLDVPFSAQTKEMQFGSEFIWDLADLEDARPKISPSKILCLAGTKDGVVDEWSAAFNECKYIRYVPKDHTELGHKKDAICYCYDGRDDVVYKLVTEFLSKGTALSGGADSLRGMEENGAVLFQVLNTQKEPVAYDVNFGIVHGVKRATGWFSGVAAVSESPGNSALRGIGSVHHSSKLFKDPFEHAHDIYKSMNGVFPARGLSPGRYIFDIYSSKDGRYPAFRSDPIEVCRGETTVIPIFAEPKPNVVVGVLDTSGSMGEQGRLNAISQAQMLVDNLSVGAYFGLVSFNENVSTIIPITKITESNRSSVKSKVSSVPSSNGNTALWDAAWSALDAIAGFAGQRNGTGGLVQASVASVKAQISSVSVSSGIVKTTSELDGLADQRVNASIILLTDGDDNASSKNKDSVAARCAALGVKLNTVAYGSAADSNLQSVSEATGGRHYKSGQDMSELGGTFLRTLSGASTRVILADYPCWTTKPTMTERAFYVDSNLTNVHMNVSISSGAEGSVVRFSSPSGRTYAGTEIAMGGGRSVTFRTANPEFGEWKISVQTDIPTKATIFADAGILDWGPALNVDVMQDRGVVCAWLSDGHSITGAQVVATVPCKGYSLEVPFTMAGAGCYTAPLEAFGPEAKTRGYTVTATIKKGEAWIDLGDGLGDDSGSPGSIAVSESATRAEYIPGEGVEESFEGVTFGDGCCVLKTMISSRWPFAGLVDIDYMLSGYQPGVSAKVSVMGRDHDLNNVEMPAATLAGAGVTTPATNGWNRVTWNLAKDYPDFHAREFSVKVSAAALMLPASIDASDGTDANVVIVTWTGKDGGTYQVWRGTSDNEKSATLLGTTTSTRYVDSSAVPGTLYYYWIRPVVGSGLGEYGISDSGWRALSAPASVSATSGGLGKIQITWSGVSLAKEYQVYRSTSSSSAGATYVTTTTATSFTDTTMLAGVRYYYWVTAVGQNKNSEFSATYGTGFSKPGMPTGIAASDGTSTASVTVTWTGIIGCRKYKVYRSENSNSSSATLIGTADGTSYTDGSAQTAKPYYYFVRATGSVCDGDLSDGDVGFRAAVLTKTAPYLVVDLSLGHNATKYPCYELSSIPGGTWSQEFKTTKLVLRRIEAGSFTMGSPTSEKGRDFSSNASSYEIQHEVTLTKPFYIGVFEVTQKQYTLVMGTNPSNGNFGDGRPVTNVKYWENVRYYGYWGNPSNTFLYRLRTRTDLGFDLPTEAQWEYACRAGKNTAINNGKNLSNIQTDSNMSLVARYAGNRYSGAGGYNDHTVVGSYAPNAWGLYDMHGNVYEWCIDFYGKYGSSAVTDPVAGSSDIDAAHVRRGGCYDSNACSCRSAARSSQKPKNGHYDDGMRVVLPL